MSCENLTKEELQVLEELGGTFFTPEQCAIVLQRDIDTFKTWVNDPQNAAFAAYERGRLLSIHEIRKNAIAMAKNGSAPAQTFVEKLLTDYEYQKALDA